MVSVRFRALVNTLLVVAGALLIGQALHLSVVTGQTDLLAVGTLGRVGVGAVLVVLGRVVHNPVEEAEERYRQREAESSRDAETEFDPDLSPIGGESGGRGTSGGESGNSGPGGRGSDNRGPGGDESGGAGSGRDER